MDSFRKTATFLVLSSALIAGPAAAQEKAWLDVNIGIATATEDTYSNAISFPFREETATFGTDYSLPRGAAFDVGGGFMFHPRIGAGISIVGAAHEDIGTLRANVPHPALFNANAADTAETDVDLRRTEASIHLQVMAVVTQPNMPVDVRVFGGPTYFRIRQDTVDDILFFETLGPGNAYTVEIDEFDLIEEVKANGWGYHFGVDVRYFFTNRVGVGGVFRFSRGEVEIPGLFGEPTDVKVGGAQFGGGLRLRF